MKLSPKTHTFGTTLVEVLVATLLLASFFASLFEANAVCLRFIAASKQSVAAIEAVQARAEVFRNLAFSDLISPSYLQNQVLNIGGSRQIGEAKVTENFGASLNNLDSPDRLLARRDKTQTKCIRLEKGCEKGGEQEGGDEDFNER